MAISIDYDLCESSGVCAMICPEDVFEHRDGHTAVLDAAACTSCWLCVEQCVSGAIALE
jgi:NAD-dependent dihydropyrimidine dehydrogenase PreA subunit